MARHRMMREDEEGRTCARFGPADRLAPAGSRSKRTWLRSATPQMISAIVLAGGKSSRMGRPKALLPFAGVPLILHTVGMLRSLFDEIVVVAAPGQDLPDMPVMLVRDEVAYQGPVGGICYGLGASTGEAAFVTSCDSAFLNPSLISHLLAQLGGHDVVVPFWEGRLQPLHAVYRRSVLPLLEAQLARGELRPIYLFDKVRTRRIEEPEIRQFDPEGRSFFNMNTPDDYAKALERWSEPPNAERRAPNAERRAPNAERRAPNAERRAPGASVPCTVELFGVARMVANAREVPLVLAPGATLSHVFAALAESTPALVGRVITPDGTALLEGYACNVNGRDFVREWTAAVNAGDTIVIVSADAGG
jgi:molybdopterin-guanine dinucleotide biosynthesis protein A